MLLLKPDSNTSTMLIDAELPIKVLFWCGWSVLNPVYVEVLLFRANSVQVCRRCRAQLWLRWVTRIGLDVTCESVGVLVALDRHG